MIHGGLCIRAQGEFLEELARHRTAKTRQNKTPYSVTEVNLPRVATSSRALLEIFATTAEKQLSVNRCDRRSSSQTRLKVGCNLQVDRKDRG